MRPRPPVGALLVLAAAAACADSAGPSGSRSAAAIAIGPSHLCQIADGSTTCWGSDQSGQLGDGAATGSTGRVVVVGNHAFVSLAAGPGRTCAIDDDGVAWCWGNNGEAELGIGTVQDDNCAGTLCQVRPVQVATSERFRSLVAGDFFTCGLARSGAVFCWGLNEADQLGTDAAPDDCGLPCSRTPIPAAGGEEFTAVSAYRNGACAIDKEGVAWCWGVDVITQAHSSTPARMGIGEDFTQLAAGGNHTCALTGSGEAWCWGIDALGAGAALLESDHPVRVAGRHAFTMLASGRVTTCGLDRDGVAWCWGPNVDGAVGVEPIGADVRFDEPVRVSGNFRFTSIAGGFNNYCGITTSGATACWGRGQADQLLNGYQSSAVPVEVGKSGRREDGMTG